MALSRQFKALGKIGAVFAVTWGAIATGVSMLTGGGFLTSLTTFGGMFAAVGGISGVTTALLVARAERGRELGEVPAWRVALWGFVGGFAPGGLFAALGLTLGSATWAAVVPLLIVGVVSGGVGAALSGTATAAARRVSLEEPEDLERLR